MKNLLYIISFSLSFFSLKGQNLEADFQKIQQVYQQADNMHFKILIESFEKGSKNGVQTQILEMKKQGDVFLYTLGHLTILKGEKHMVWVNKKEKSIQYSDKPSSQFEQTLMKSFNEKQFSAIKNMGKFYFLGIKKGRKHYSQRTNQPGRPSIDIFIDNKTGLLKEIKYDFTNQAYGGYVMHTKMLVTNLNPDFEAKIFDEGNFLKESANQKLAAKNYSGFTVSNISENY